MTKTGKKSQKPYLTDYKLLVPQDLWQVHYRPILIILLNEFRKINVNTNITKEKCEICGIKYKIATVFLNLQTLVIIY